MYYTYLGFKHSLAARCLSVLCAVCRVLDDWWKCARLPAGCWVRVQCAWLLTECHSSEIIDIILRLHAALQQNVSHMMKIDTLAQQTVLHMVEWHNPNIRLLPIYVPAKQFPALRDEYTIPMSYVTVLYAWLLESSQLFLQGAWLLSDCRECV